MMDTEQIFMLVLFLFVFGYSVYKSRSFIKDYIKNLIYMARIYGDSIKRDNDERRH